MYVRSVKVKYEDIDNSLVLVDNCKDRRIFSPFVDIDITIWLNGEILPWVCKCTVETKIDVLGNYKPCWVIKTALSGRIVDHRKITRISIPNIRKREAIRCLFVYSFGH